jgi:hypothetical protein
MLTVYGSANGFGWKKDEIIGAEIISVPLSVPVAIADRVYHRLLLFLVLTMVAAILALDAGVYFFVIRPLRIVSETDRATSRGPHYMGKSMGSCRERIRGYLFCP